MIDQDKTVISIDFDRMIKTTNGSDDDEYEHTADFGSDFVAPEIGNGIVSDKCDIYSIGQMIKYIIASNETNNNDSQIEEIYEMCTQENYKQRPSIDELFHLFLSSYHSKIKSSLLENISEEMFKIGCLHYNGDQVPKGISKSIFYFTLDSKYNHVKAQHILGFIYINGKDVPKDIN
ncbi:hypothetical protein M9Y10_036028 [Tritrichomonas musculus]|uniref:Protein kinase domain-containing protein n=1 Tax=Tritrichomonas musculus TaxID=1915356 RepID=A0ABR2GWX5_9EUKA